LKFFFKRCGILPFVNLKVLFWRKKSSNAAAKQSTKSHGLRFPVGMVLARRVRSTHEQQEVGICIRGCPGPASSNRQSRAWKAARGTGDACRIHACRREQVIAAELPGLGCLLLSCFVAVNSQTMLQQLLIKPEIMLLARAVIK
jgi:hypothetical protein